MKTGSKAQKGFTLIEVSLAIVIGVIVLAGAITLYNQSKVSAGNSKAQEKALALAGLVEELAASNNMQYPQISSVDTAWKARRDDAMSSPWGGALSAGAAVRLAGNAANSGTFAWDTGTSAKYSGAVQASAGVAVYTFKLTTDNNATTSVYDAGVVSSRTYSNFFVGIVNPAAEGPAFTSGGK